MTSDGHSHDRQTFEHSLIRAVACLFHAFLAPAVHSMSDEIDQIKESMANEKLAIAKQKKDEGDQAFKAQEWKPG